MSLQANAASLLRIVAGVGVGFHGLRKLMAGPATLLGETIAKMGFPQPEVFAWAIALGETAGFLLAIGMLTRFAGAAVAMAMAGIAIFGNGHLWSALGTGPAVALEYSALLAVTGLYFAITGPVGWSVDVALVGKKRARKRA